ncbi:hypothetical protein D9V30_08425 [Mycetocola reblochoni]|uniref:Minor tail protein n=2 Tax=Mycetocola reblochoni TaxID=331618 RepID=A0A1R4JQE9_9MICO|nr:phage tail domain-containing protein [Mycetocola reblochoni]RLP69322.1 hypothetical protein D9V30_08425 [Mycetocola reblochoni]SJN34202.1 hypothetical protein FM119_08825 [Mycetocola reblochoni REB411]
MAGIEFVIVSPVGDVVPLASGVNDPGDFRLMTGVVGFGAPGVDVNARDSAGGGLIVRNFRVQARSFNLPVGIDAVDRFDMADKQRRLEAATHAQPGLPYPRLRATYATGRVLELPFYVTSGFEETYTETGERWTVFDLTATAPKPYWRDTETRDFAITPPLEGVPLLTNLATIPLTAGAPSGELTVTNPGDVAVPLEWEAVGPFTRAEITVGGDRFVIGALTSAEAVIIRASQAGGFTVQDGSGGDAYSKIGPAPRFPSMPAGVRQVRATVTGQASGSRITGRFRPAYRSVF